MKCLYANNQSECAPILAHKITESLAKGDVLWLIPGGSNIPLSVSAMKLIRAEVSKEHLSRLSVSLTDERFGSMGHSDSNWKQLIDAGFNFADIKAFPILTGASLRETVDAYEKHARDLFKKHSSKGTIIGQFGIGADGHIAGVLPRTVGVATNEYVVGYETGTFTRISLSLSAISHISIAFAFAFGASKKETMSILCSQNMSLDLQPAQVLKLIPESYIYSDQI